MRIWIWFLGSSLLALICIWALAHVLLNEFAWIPPVLNGVFVFSSGIGSLLVRKSIERRTRTDSPNSIERSLAINSRSDAFPAQLIMTTGLGAYLINANAFGPGLACLGVTVLGIAWFWIRYGRLLSRA